MVQFFVSMIRQGKIALDDVPARWRDEVNAALTALTETEAIP